jgi:hypothetical protein
MCRTISEGKENDRKVFGKPEYVYLMTLDLCIMSKSHRLVVVKEKGMLFTI